MSFISPATFARPINLSRESCFVGFRFNKLNGQLEYWWHNPVGVGVNVGAFVLSVIPSRLPPRLPLPLNASTLCILPDNGVIAKY